MALWAQTLFYFLMAGTALCYRGCQCGTILWNRYEFVYNISISDLSTKNCKELYCKWMMHLCIFVVQVNLCQKLSFLNQLTQTMRRDCSLNSKKIRVNNILCTKIIFCFCFDILNNICTLDVVNLYFSWNSMNNLSTYCGLITARMRASEKYLPVIEKMSLDLFAEHRRWRHNYSRILLELQLEKQMPLPNVRDHNH